MIGVAGEGFDAQLKTVDSDICGMKVRRNTKCSLAAEKKRTEGTDGEVSERLDVAELLREATVHFKGKKEDRSAMNDRQ